MAVNGSDNKALWQKQLAQAISDPAELIQILKLNPEQLPQALLAARQFPLRVPRGFVARMQAGNPEDPLLKQVLPLGIELHTQPGYVQDALAERLANPIPGLLHKYHGRVLLTITSACGINCRFCFRRHFPYEENNPGTAGWDKALAYIANDEHIKEVILSGGDPLAASDAYIEKLVQKIAAIPHVKTLRIHSRLPIVIPERISAELISWLTTTRLKPVLVTHCNHAQEINEEVRAALWPLRQAGVTLLNQTVLLKGINDSPASLIALSEALFEAGILPYYLHMPDKIQGTAHFDVSDEAAKALHWEITQKLPGYLAPRLVREVPGAPAKLAVK